MKPSMFATTVLFALVAMISPVVGQTAGASQAYDYKIIATKDQNIGGWTLSSIENNPTINDNGHIGFVGSVQTGGEALFLWDERQNEVLSVAFNGTYGSAAINNSDQVATCFSATINGNSVSEIRRYSGPNSFAAVNEAGNAQDPQVPGTFIYPYGSFMPQVAISSIGTVVFGAVNHVG